jgi:hypothetical protein
MRFISRRGFPKLSSRQREQAGCLEIANALGAMSLVKCLRGFHATNSISSTRTSTKYLPVLLAVIGNHDSALLCDGQTALAQLVR